MRGDAPQCAGALLYPPNLPTGGYNPTLLAQYNGMLNFINYQATQPFYDIFDDQTTSTTRPCDYWSTDELDHQRRLSLVNIAATTTCGRETRTTALEAHSHCCPFRLPRSELRRQYVLH